MPFTIGLLSLRRDSWHVTRHLRYVLPRVLLACGNSWEEFCIYLHKVGEEAEDMDGQEPTLFCGIERLEIDIGVAVAVALDVFVDLVLDHRPKHGAILHINVCLYPST